MEPLFLFGQYEVKVDAKNRLGVPAELRRRINPESHGKDFYMVVGQNRRPWLYCDKFYEELVTRQQTDLAASPDVSDFDRMSLALAEHVKLDPQGRILIPVGSMNWLGLQQEKDLFLIGVRDHAELWLKADWEAERAALLARGPDIVARARQARDRS